MDAPPSSSRSPRPRLVVGGRIPPPPPPPPPPDNDRTTHELRASDCNLAALCDHVKHEGFNAGAFSDVVVEAMGSTFRLHRLILSRSSYFRNMLHGPWKEADAPTVTLQIDDDNINNEAISMALAYLYGHHPKLNDNNAFRVLAAASFLDLQDLCAICTDFIISELWISNFLAYQIFAESQDYGIHGERVRKACWGYLCQSGTMELREVLPKLSSQTLHSLLTSDRLWVPNEEKRFELALYTLLAKGALVKEFMEKAILSSESGLSPSITSSQLRQQEVTEDIDNKMTSELEDVNIQNDADCEIDFDSNTSYSRTEKIHEGGTSHPIIDSYTCEMEKHVPPVTSISNSNIRSSCAYAGTNDDLSSVRMVVDGSATDAPSEENSGYPFNNDVWLSREQPRHFSSDHSPCNSCSNDEWGKSTPCWGARTVGWSQGKHAEENHGIYGDDYDTFVSIFERGSLLYCNMSFEALLNVRKQLEELGFPCKAVNDGLWLQMLLSHRVHEIGADTCRNCCMMSLSCTCPPPYGCSQGASTGYYSQQHDQNDSPGMGNVYFSDAQGEGTGTYGPVRVQVRGPIDGLAGIGRGTTFVPGGVAWPPTRYVFSRVPFGLGNRNGQQSLGNDDSEARIDHNGEFPADGLTALVGHCHGGNVGPVPMEHAQRAYVPGSVNLPTSNSIQLQILESQQQGLGSEWESPEVSSLSLDMKTPLHRFPPFRFGVEFIDVHRLVDGQVKHSPEVFYAGSLWKVSVQAFNDEDSQGRRTLGLFLHRRKAEPTDSSRKVHMYVDSREKVTARYQLICPSKREVMVFGSLKQPGTLLPKAPKGWGWRTALLFDELGDLLQGGALRVAAVVQLI